jgi:hypothetical protein
VRKLYLLLIVALMLTVSTMTFAHDGTHTANLGALNGSGASGTATVQVITHHGNQVTVTIQSSGLAPNQPHAQHIHIGGQNTCPSNAADMDGDGLINTAEGAPFYGGVQVSLTTQGDVSADSALAVDRFPVADANGNLNYSRTFPLPQGVNPQDIDMGVIVQHGISKLFGDPNQYDGDPRSSLDPSLPLEATIPATCGKLMAAAAMMPNTGAGDLPLAIIAAPFVLLAAGLVTRRYAVLARR